MNDSQYPNQAPQDERPNPEAAGGGSEQQTAAFRPSQAQAHAPAGGQTAQMPNYQQATASVQPPVAEAVAPAASATHSGGWAKAIVSALIGAIVAVVVTLGVSGAVNTTPAGTDAGESAQQAQTSDQAAGSTINVQGDDITLPEAVAAKTLPSVVCIYVYTEQTTGGFFEPVSTSEQLSSLGSGVILSDDGYVITNNHVIEGESSLKVSVNGGQYDATVVGTDESSDLAVIKIEGADNLTPIEVGSSSDLVVGEWVMTVGSPYGMEQSVGAGIVSAVSRSSASLQDTESGAIYANLIQTDAPINPGNSGGALVNEKGQLVGINTLTASYSGSNSGVGFAIPSDYAVSIANEIIAGEEPSHAQLGVSLISIDQATAERYHLSAQSGAYVASVAGGAQEAGIQEGDIITKIGDTEVTSATDVILAVRSKSPGDTITVEVNRDGDTKSFDVKLGSDTDSGNAGANAQSGQESGSGGAQGGN